MPLTELWQSADEPTLSYELFPPRTPKAATKLELVIDRLAATEPDFVAVTSGAGGTTRQGSLELARQLSQDRGLRVLPYCNGCGLGPEEIDATLSALSALGLDSALLVRGDPPQGVEDFEPHPRGFAHASDLLQHVAPRHQLCLGVAAYPEAHKEAESLARDICFLKLKQDHGARFAITNFFYDNELFYAFCAAARQAGVSLPILPGVMPIFNLKTLHKMVALCGASIPDALRAGLAALPEGDKAALAEFGVRFAVDQCRDLLAHGVPGLHLYTLDKSKASVAVVSALRREGLL